MDSYIPAVTEPPVPIPYGDLPISITESLTTPHPITVSNPLQVIDFPESAQGAVAHTALCRVEEFFSHGFQTPNNPDAPPRNLWLRSASEIVAMIHNSIHRTHTADPLPNAFADLDITETTSLDLFQKTISSFSNFFSNYNNDTRTYKVCLRCLKEMAQPIDKAAYESVLMSCTQNIHAAHCTVINVQLRSLTNEMDEWVLTCHDSIKHNFIMAVVSDDASSLYDSTDPCLLDWANRTKDTFHLAACNFITDTVIKDTIDPWVIESFQACKALADQEALNDINNHTRDLRASEEQRANEDAAMFYNSTFAALKAEALERAERKVAEYKSNLKVAAEK